MQPRGRGLPAAARTACGCEPARCRRARTPAITWWSAAGPEAIRVPGAALCQSACGKHAAWQPGDRGGQEGSAMARRTTSRARTGPGAGVRRLTLGCPPGPQHAPLGVVPGSEVFVPLTAGAAVATATAAPTDLKRQVRGWWGSGSGAGKRNLPATAVPGPDRHRPLHPARWSAASASTASPAGTDTGIRGRVRRVLCARINRHAKMIMELLLTRGWVPWGTKRYRATCAVWV